MQDTKEQNITINLEKQTYQYKKTTTNWQVTLKQSEVQVHSEKELALLNVVNPLLLNAAMIWEEDAVTFDYQLPQDCISFANLQSRTQEDKLRAMVNVADLQQLLALPLTFFIHPENIVFDHNLLPKVAYRGLAGKMPPKVTDEALFLRQYKCLIITLFETKQSFTQLYEGQLEIKKGSEFIKTIINAQTIDGIKTYLTTTYNQTVAKNNQTLKSIPKRKFQVMKQLSIWMSVLTVVLFLPLMYLVFFRLPFLDRMQQTDTAFLKNDYEAVINTLEPVKTKKIPFTQKYELSYSFVQGKELNDQQRKVVLNNITLRANEDYLDYWIENGRGDLDEALDIAKKLEDADLIMYGITQKIEQIRNDTKMTGTEKEEEINKLEENYKKYDEKRQKGADAVKEAQESSSSTTAKKETQGE